MDDLKTWWSGFAIIVAFIVIGELSIVFREYVYARMGLSRNFVLMLLWLLPVIASFLVVFRSKKRKLLKGLSFILVLSFLGPLAHFLFGQLGATIDFAGLQGLRVTFQIYLVLSVVTIGLGSVIGILFSREKGKNTIGQPGRSG
ncbi:MAG: hypothetical protein GY820_08215 [Gammaproteobacteria bacterium]|nr:hypothetical protein [Gammaproteobacteria bacterium]